MSVVATLVLGLGTGLLSGMFGVGGAVVSTPGIRALGVGPLEAVGTTIPAIIPSALAGSLRYHRDGLLELRIVAWVAISGAAAAVGTSFLAHAIPGDGHWLMVMTAVMVLWTSIRVARAQAPERRAAAGPRRDTPGRLAVCGVGAGSMSGLLGLGGGVILVPAFLEWLHLPIKRAVGSSLACVGLLAVPSGITHAFLGDIDWAFALPLAVTVVPGARIGAHLAIRSSDRALRIIVAAGLAVIAVVYATREITLLG
ncbi:MAG: sulfite exporter TauE/SafE family protein [Actinobacteria bacterium]|nr:sulfite exporter TauE/SafE family protein [Actinomycetota bacterium]